METFHAQITNYLLAQSWQIALLALVIASASFAARNKSAHVRYLLWLIVLAKCLVPPLFAIPLAILPAEKQVEPVQALPIAVPSAFVNSTDAAGVEAFVLPAVAKQPEPTITERLASIGSSKWLGLGWILGTALFAVAAIARAVRTNRRLRCQRRPLPAELQAEIQNFFAGLGVKTLPRVWLVDGIGQPFVWGLLRGGIYLPADFGRTGDAEHRRGVLGHELGHILRFDATINLLQIIGQAIFWFHPFVWWANNKIRAEREKCCDEMAIARLGAKAKEFSTAIVNTLVVEHESVLPVPSLAVAGPVKNIEDRIKTMMQPGKKFYKRPSFVVVITTLLFAAVAVPTTLALTRRSAPEPGVEASVEDMVGTWFFDNPAGDEEQMAIFADGRVVVLYSNGHKDKVHYENGFVELPEYNNARAKMVLKNKDTLLQFFTHTETEEFAKKWMRISAEPHTNLLRPLTGEAKDEPVAEKGWGRVEGRLLIGNRTAQDEDIRLYPFDMDANKLIGDVQRAVTDSEGKFVFENVPAGWAQIGRLTKIGKAAYSVTNRRALEIKAGQTHHITIGRSGRTVIGRFVLPADYHKPVDFGYGLRALHTFRPEPPYPQDYDQMTNSERQQWITAWARSGEGRAFYRSHRIKERAFTFNINNDGTFRIEDVPAGKYTLTVWVEEPFEGKGPSKEIAGFGAAFEIPGASGRQDDEPFNLGILELTIRDQEPSANTDVKPDEERRAGETGRRVASAEKLKDLGKALIVYANDDDAGRYPNTLRELVEGDYMSRTLLEWALENVEYLGKGKTAADAPGMPLAYDKTLLEKGQGTNVLYNDTHVAFVKLGRLAGLGIGSEMEGRPELAARLHQLALALKMYCDDHNRNLADSLPDLKAYVGNEQHFKWIAQNVEYLGKGKTAYVRRAARIPVAYNKSLLQKIDGTDVLFLDFSVRFLQSAELKKYETNRRVESARRLSNLGKALIVYANDDDAGRYPNTLRELVEGDYMSRALLEWALENVEYLGKGKTAADDPGLPLAYDKTLLEKGDGTNVLYNDSHVAFEKGERLERLGILGSLTEPMGTMRPANTFVTGMAILTDRPPKALDLESGRTVELKDSWPSDFDVAWDNDAGGTLIRRPDEWAQAWQGPVRLLALEGAKNIGEAFILAREHLEELGQSDATGIPAKKCDSRFILVQTSNGNVVVVEIHDFDSNRAFIEYKFLSGHGVHQDSGQRRRRVRRPPRRTNNEPVLTELAAGPQIKFGMRVLQIPGDLDQIDEHLSEDLKDYLAGRFPKENHITIGSQQVDRLLKWVSTLKEAEMLAAPTVVVLSGEAATVRIETENGYIAGYDESAGGEPQPQYETVSDGVAFMVKGQVLADSNAIDFQVDFNYTKVEGFENYTYKQRYPYQQPIMSTTQTRTRAVIPDGESALIGGTRLSQGLNEKGGKNLLILVTVNELGDKRRE